MGAEISTIFDAVRAEARPVGVSARLHLGGVWKIGFVVICWVC